MFMQLFVQLQDLMANIFGTKHDIDNQLSALEIMQQGIACIASKFDEFLSTHPL